MYRDWPEEHYKELFKLLKPHFDIILLDHSRNKIFSDVVDACGFSLRKALGILSQCDGLITVDTSLLHFGAAMEVPTVAIFGPIDYRARCKGYKDVTVITTSELDCMPCWRNSNMQCKQTGIVKGHSKCLQIISPRHVARVARKKFER